MNGWQIAAAVIFVFGVVCTFLKSDDVPEAFFSLVLSVAVGYVYYRAGLFG